MAEPNLLRIAATSDLHYDRHAKGKWRELFAHASREADVLLICGDITDYGLPDEAHMVVEDLMHCTIPVLAVLGNHDFESNRHEEVRTILEHAKVSVLDGESTVVNDVGFAGVCGFGGGFGRRMLNAWGEPGIKQFVQEAVDQAMRLERALSRLNTQHKIVLLHYAPIRETVAGEDPEIYPFMGSTRLEGPLNRYSVTAAFHGHAHGGTHEGKTSAGVPVFNVSVPVLNKRTPEQMPLHFYHVRTANVGPEETAPVTVLA
jgi:Icc-related predicted phosphoesterase